ncbi:hypothetical protein SAMN05421754_100420 [Nitrosomonas sp. Nm58]|nr:hypothetical protein SAMN05421754_100420 [Nitrosomonas sp. Nm58]
MAHHFNKPAIEPGIQPVKLLIQLVMIQSLVFTRKIIILFKMGASPWQTDNILRIGINRQNRVAAIAQSSRFAQRPQQRL